MPWSRKRSRRFVLNWLATGILGGNRCIGRYFRPVSGQISTCIDELHGRVLVARFSSRIELRHRGSQRDLRCYALQRDHFDSLAEDTANQKSSQRRSNRAPASRQWGDRHCRRCRRRSAGRPSDRAGACIRRVARTPWLPWQLFRRMVRNSSCRLCCKRNGR